MTSRAKGQVPEPGGIQAPGGSGAQGCELRFWLNKVAQNLSKNVPGSATHEKVGRHGTCCFATAPRRTHSTRTYNHRQAGQRPLPRAWSALRQIRVEGLLYLRSDVIAFLSA